MNLQGKKALLMGLANERSIAWGIAKAFKKAGAELGFTYIDAVEKRMRPLAEEMEASFIARCDVQSDQDIQAMADGVKEKWGKVDILVHALAFADRADLEKDFVFTSRKGFQMALDVSAYSLVATTAALLPVLEASENASVMTLTYYGAEKVVPNYNVMGVAKAALEASVRYLAADCGKRNIRVNAISAGPIRTLAASGVKDFRSILTKIEENSPLKRNVTIDDVGGTALFLASDASRGMTGEVLYVDSGYNIMGL